MHKTIFVDTNIFLQCLPLDQLSWREILEEGEITVLIPRVVQDEIDRLKHDGNSRRSQRARKANSFMRDILLSGSDYKILREREPIVRIGFSPNLKIDPSEFPELDLARPDNQIIAEAIIYSRQFEDTSFLSHDTNPLLTARRFCLKWISIPDSWILKPEQDPRDKKIADLEKSLKAYEKNSPVIQMKAKISEGENNGSIEVFTYNKLSDYEVNKFIDFMKNRFPLKTEFPIPQNAIPMDTVGHRLQTALMGAKRYEPPSTSEISKYQKELYPKWCEELKVYFSDIHLRMDENKRYIGIEVEIENIGIVPAENFEIHFKVMSGASFASKLLSTQSHRQLNLTPSPPSPPKHPIGGWRFDGGMGSLMMEYQKSMKDNRFGMGPFYDNIIASRDNNERDLKEFYWKGPVGSYSDERVLECKEYRHKTDSRLIRIEVFIPNGYNSNELCVLITATAKNLPDPVKAVLKVELKSQLKDLNAELPPFLEREINKVKYDTNFEGKQ